MRSNQVLKLQEISYRYDQRGLHGVHNLSFELLPGRTLCLLGPSGSGKSTLLKLIHNELSAQTGEIKNDFRKTSKLFNESELLKQTTVEHYLVGHAATLTQDEDKAYHQVRGALSKVDLEACFTKNLSQLSSGQKQRLRLIKPLLDQADLILLDEPFDHLDWQLRKSCLEESFSLFHELGSSVLWVTHNTEDALEFSDELLFINAGEQIQTGCNQEVLSSPLNTFIAQYLGYTNIFIPDLDGKTILNSKVEIPSDLLPSDYGALAFSPFDLKKNDQGPMSAKVISCCPKAFGHTVRLLTPEGFELELVSKKAVPQGQTLFFDIDWDQAVRVEEV